MFFETGVARGIDCRAVRGGTPSRSPEHPGGPPPPVLLPPGTSAVPGNEQPWGRGFVLGGQNRQTIRVTPPGDQAANLAAEITETPPLISTTALWARWLSRAQSRVGSGPFCVRSSLLPGCRALPPSPLAKNPLRWLCQSPPGPLPAYANPIEPVVSLLYSL